MIAIQDLEEAREEALKQTMKVQAKRKDDFDAKLPKDHGIQTEGMVLLYDNRHEEFLDKLHTRWMGPYMVTYIFENGSLQLEDLQENWLDTRVNGSRLKQYQPLPQRPGKELVAESVKIELPATAAKIKIEKDSDTPKTSSEPSP